MQNFFIDKIFSSEKSLLFPFQLEYFQRKLLIYRIEFSACGFFIIDRKILTKVYNYFFLHATRLFARFYLGHSGHLQSSLNILLFFCYQIGGIMSTFLVVLVHLTPFSNTKAHGQWQDWQFILMIELELTEEMDGEENNEITI